MSYNRGQTDGVRWPRMLGVEQAAEYLSLSPKTIRNGLARDAERPFPVKPKRYGRRVLFDIRDLDAYVDALPYGPCIPDT